jgi:ABC-type oligopeptide transport system substrate-binding subunit
MGGGYANPEYDEVCAQAAMETDQIKRSLLFQQAEKLLQTDAACIPTYSNMYNLLLKPYITNWSYSTMGLTLLKRVCFSQ